MLGEVRQPGVAGSLDSPHGESMTNLPHPELYILVNGIPSKLNVVWRSLINVDALKGAIHKLKEINWLYKEVDEDNLDDVARESIETVCDTSDARKGFQRRRCQLSVLHNADIKFKAVHLV